MDQLNEEQIEEFKEVFNLFDPNKNGYIQSKELGTILRSIGIQISDEEKNTIIKKYEEIQGDIIYFQDFLDILFNKMSSDKPEDYLLDAFKLFESDIENVINIDDFKKEISDLLPSVSEKERNNLIDSIKTGNSINIPFAISKLLNYANPYLPEKNN